MQIGGFQKFSLIDFPDKLTAIVFTHGCNFRCSYCHNPELFDQNSGTVDEQEILDFLKKRSGKLDALVVTGGEPTLQKDLPDFMRKVKKIGYLTKLDTNGTNPKMLEDLISSGLVDYIAMDVKGTLEKYVEISNSNVDVEKIKKSILLIKNSGVKHEFRTTVVKEQLKIEDFKKIGELIEGSRYFLQKFAASKLLDPSFANRTTYSDQEFAKIKKILNNYTENCFIR